MKLQTGTEKEVEGKSGRRSIRRAEIRGFVLACAIVVPYILAGRSQTVQGSVTGSSVSVEKVPVQTPKPTSKPVAVKYTLKKAKNGELSVIRIKKGHKKKVKNQFVKLKKATYYVGGKGIALKGWRKIKKKYYYFDRKTAKMHRSKSKVDGITCEKGGAAKQTKYNRAKIQVMMSARKVMERVTKKTDSKSVKMEKCFRWIMKFPYRRYRIVRKVKNHRGWELDFANDMFIRKQGCCVSNASAYAFLAKECGCKKTYLCDDTGHGWAEVNGRVFDPLFAEAKSFRGNYNARYGVYKLHPIGKKKI